MRIIAKDQSQVAEYLVELAHATKMWQFYDTQWNTHFGAPLKIEKNKWKKKVQEILLKMGLTQEEMNCPGKQKTKIDAANPL